MKQFSTGEAAQLIGVNRDKVTNAIRSTLPGAPRPSMKIGKYHAFTKADIVSLCDWFESRGVVVTRPDFAVARSPK